MCDVNQEQNDEEKNALDKGNRKSIEICSRSCLRSGEFSIYSAVLVHFEIKLKLWKSNEFNRLEFLIRVEHKRWLNRRKSIFVSFLFLLSCWSRVWFWFLFGAETSLFAIKIIQRELQFHLFAFLHFRCSNNREDEQKKGAKQANIDWDSKHEVCAHRRKYQSYHSESLDLKRHEWNGRIIIGEEHKI